MLFTSIFNTSEILYQLNVKHVVLSSGSRNAPLVISFARNENLKKWIIPDERSAGFIAVGMAQKTQSPVALCLYFWYSIAQLLSRRYRSIL